VFSAISAARNDGGESSEAAAIPLAQGPGTAPEQRRADPDSGNMAYAARISAPQAQRAQPLTPGRDDRGAEQAAVDPADVSALARAAEAGAVQSASPAPPELPLASSPQPSSTGFPETSSEDWSDLPPEARLVKAAQAHVARETPAPREDAVKAGPLQIETDVEIQETSNSHPKDSARVF
jgi:hypothetical protein